MIRGHGGHDDRIHETRRRAIGINRNAVGSMMGSATATTPSCSGWRCPARRLRS
jgi:hypothetical protein